MILLGAFMAQDSWTEQQLERLIHDQVLEDTQLEYKSVRALDTSGNRERVIFEISKDVSAMANASGGSIIYGIREDNHLPESIESGFDPSEGKHEWLENIISSHIKPKIPDLKIIPVQLTKTFPGRVALAVIVPQSLTGNQANDKRYYQRRNFSIEMLEDYQVRDLFNRPKHPIINTNIDYKLLDTGDGKLHRYALLASIKNDGPVRIRDLRMELLIPERIFMIEGTIVVNPQNYNIHVVDDSVMLTSGHEYKAKRVIYHREDQVVFPTQEIEILGMLTPTKPFISYKVDHNIFLWAHDPGIEISWTVYADDMPPQQGHIPVSQMHKF
jgi:hypothetical protein